MTYNLEVAGLPATFTPETLTVCVSTVPVAKEMQVDVCAWCDPTKYLSRSLGLAGYMVSHGICKSCREKLFSV